MQEYIWDNRSRYVNHDHETQSCLCNGRSGGNQADNVVLAAILMFWQMFDISGDSWVNSWDAGGCGSYLNRISSDGSSLINNVLLRSLKEMPTCNSWTYFERDAAAAGGWMTILFHHRHYTCWWQYKERLLLLAPWCFLASHWTLVRSTTSSKHGPLGLSEEKHWAFRGWAANVWTLVCSFAWQFDPNHEFPFVKINAV